MAPWLRNETVAPSVDRELLAMEYVAGSLCMICGGFLLVLGVLSVRAWMSGWMWLAKRYRFQSPLPQMNLRGQSGAVGGHPFNVCLSISAERNGLLLAVSRWTSFAHPPLLIPWSELTVHAEEVSGVDALGLFCFWSAGLFQKFTEVSVSGPPPTSLLLPPQSLPPRIPDACREARNCFEAEFPDEEVRRVALELVDDDRFVVAVSYGYGEKASREYYSVLRGTMQASRIAEYP
jgi:hypothetical protein